VAEAREALERTAPAERRADERTRLRAG